MKKVAILVLIWVLISSALTVQTVFGEEYYLKVITDTDEYIYYYPEVYLSNGEYRLNGKSQKIERICADSLVLPTNASVKTTSDKKNRFIVTNENNGRVIDDEFLSMQIDTALKKGQKEIRVVYRELYAEMDSAYINRCLNLRSSFSTDYSSSNEERKFNISLACQKINGTILFSNEEFSFNKIVGKRTQENGYKTAKTIENGVFVDGVGGGVCQVSTTLYNAVLLGGLKISEYHPHSLSVGYVEKSFDAMVTDLWADLKFVNNTGGLAFVFAEANGEKLTVWIYGTKKTCDYERESVVEEEILPETFIEEVDGLLTGEKVVKVKGKSGFKSKGYLKIYYNGNLLDRVLIRTDEYKKIDEVVLCGA